MRIIIKVDRETPRYSPKFQFHLKTSMHNSTFNLNLSPFPHIPFSLLSSLNPKSHHSQKRQKPQQPRQQPPSLNVLLPLTRLHITRARHTRTSSRRRPRLHNRNTRNRRRSSSRQHHATAGSFRAGKRARGAAPGCRLP